MGHVDLFTEYFVFYGNDISSDLWSETEGTFIIQFLGSFS